MLSKALDEARKLKTPEAKVRRLVQIATQFYYSSRHRDNITAILTEATHYAREIQSPHAKMQALEELAMCWERIGESEKARILSNEAMRIRQRVFEVFGLKRDIVMKAAQSGDLTELKEILKRVSDPMVANMLLQETVVELARKGQVKEVIALVNELAGKEYQ
ncbi:MAG: hypothetical protein NZ805_16435, partial [Armatimonadetes bacterium]|nr:hypothetical protein [Armatimonadota bacterium]MDW8030183.1 hypothetical protein [Armatimonadota bacterium]